MITVWILWVLVFADGDWRAWEHTYTTLEACDEIRRVITHHRDKQLQATCLPKMVPTR